MRGFFLISLEYIKLIYFKLYISYLCMKDNSSSSWWDHLTDLTMPAFKEFKNQYWWKAWWLEFLATFPELKPYILSWHYFAQEDIKAWKLWLPKYFQDRVWKLLFRTSHPDDIFDHIGTLPTLSDSSEGIILDPESLIERIQSRIERVYWNWYLKRNNLRDPATDYGIYVQETLSDIRCVGSVVEHPNKLWIYIVSYYYVWNKHSAWNMQTSFIWENDEVLWWYHGYTFEGGDSHSSEWIKDVVRLYKRIKIRKPFDKSISFQMEFWTTDIDSPYIFQIRQFRPFEDFQSKSELSHRWLCFWKTQDLRIDAEFQDDMSINLGLIESPQSGINGLILTHLQDRLHPEYDVSSLDFVALWEMVSPNLEHNVYSLAMRVQNIFLDSSWMRQSEYWAESWTKTRLQYNSDWWNYQVKRVSA